MTNYNRQMFTISDFGFSRFRIWDCGLRIADSFDFGFEIADCGF